MYIYTHVCIYIYIYVYVYTYILQYAIHYMLYSRYHMLDMMPYVMALRAKCYTPEITNVKLHWKMPLEIH